MAASPSSRRAAAGRRNIRRAHEVLAQQRAERAAYLRRLQILGAQARLAQLRGEERQLRQILKGR